MTPDILSSHARRASGNCWRVIEAQHRVSTLKITDTQAEQELLESLIEASKPAVPKECEHLHYLLSTPFRYGAPYPHGSRFRRAGLTPGVFYASDHVETAIAEAVFWRLLFYADSPDTPWPANAGEYTAFACAYSTGRAIDLTRPPLDARREAWMHPTRLDECQTLAEAARAANIDVIRYASVRDPRCCAAGLSPSLRRRHGRLGAFTWAPAARAPNASCRDCRSISTGRRSREIPALCGCNGSGSSG
jgi:hypothetical protein